MVTKIQIAGKLKFYTKPYGRQWKWRYQVHGHVMTPKAVIPKGLEHVKIIDPLKPETIPKKEVHTVWTPPRRHPILECLLPQPTLKDHPDYKEQPIKLFDRTSKFHAGIDQACLLTKTKPVNNLPSSILNLSNSFKLNDQDDLVKNYIRQALAFNPTKEECQPLKIPHDPKFKIGREFATPHSKQMSILLENLIRLCNLNISKIDVNCLTSRMVVSKSPLSTIFQRGDDLIQVKRNSDFTVFSNKKHKAIAEPNEIGESAEYSFVDMYPVFPTIDLKDEHVYNLSQEATIGWKNADFQFGNVHTFFHANDDQVSNETDVSRLIMYAFAYCYAQSQRLKKQNKLELNEKMELLSPIVVNGVSMTHQRLNFITYQMNTLNLNDNHGVKNLVYYDVGNELYHKRPTVEQLPYPTYKNLQRLALRYLDYNPDAFKKLLSILAINA